MSCTIFLLADLNVSWRKKVLYTFPEMIKVTKKQNNWNEQTNYTRKCGNTILHILYSYLLGWGGGQDVLHCNVWIADPEALLHALLYQSFTAGWSLAQRKGWIHQQLDYKNKHCVNSACSKERYCVNWHASKWIKLQISLLSARLSLILCASVTDRRGH